MTINSDFFKSYHDVHQHIMRYLPLEEHYRVARACQVFRNAASVVGIGAVPRLGRVEYIGWESSINAVEIIEGENLVITGSEHGYVSGWDIPSFKMVWTHFIGSNIHAITELPGKNSVMVGCGAGIIYKIDVKDGFKSAPLAAHNGGVRSIAINSNATLCISGSNDKKVALHCLNEGTTKQSFQDHNQAVTAVTIHEGSDSYISGDSDGNVVVRSLSTPYTKKYETSEHDRILALVAENFSSLSFICSSQDRSMKVFAEENGQLAIQSDLGSIPNGGMVKAASASGKVMFGVGREVQVYDFTKIRPIYTAKDEVTVMDLSPSGRWLVYKVRGQGVFIGSSSVYVEQALLDESILDTSFPKHDQNRLELIKEQLHAENARKIYALELLLDEVIVFLERLIDLPIIEEQNESGVNEMLTRITSFYNKVGEKFIYENMNNNPFKENLEKLFNDFESNPNLITFRAKCPRAFLPEEKVSPHAPCCIIS